MATGTYISITTLNVNGLNDPTKRHRLAKWIQKQDPYIYAVYKKPISDLKTYVDWKWEDGKNIFHANGKQKKAGVAILISDQIDLKIKKITRDKEGHYIIDQEINPRGRHNNCKYLCTQHRSTSIHRTNTNRHKRRNWQ